MLVAGLTGSYGMGKSTVLGMFMALGALTIGADEIVDELLHERAVLDRIRTSLGDGVFSEGWRLDRARVASLIFRDKEKRDALEGILHPLVFQRIREFLEREEKRESRRVVIVEIPLLFEKGDVLGLRKNITVYADEEVVMRRLESKGVGRDMAGLRLAAQMSIKEKIERADFAIENNGNLEHTEDQVRAVYASLLAELAADAG